MNVRASASDKNDARGVQSIEMGAKLLNVLVDEEEPMMLKVLARLAGIAPAQAHAYLVSYRKLGLIEQEEPAGRYRLGPFALERFPFMLDRIRMR
ncbi:MULTISPECIES: helix-turn-helix domain-containing protein [Rhizobium/Agrobacterium group]|uniref:helix-turn-helix domain-containing protein n=1 Tax=Rhizobium/Agrobacterium group TaxID=227290 RepID=UPI001ADC6729|nr:MULTISPECIES: helix-turn-helix domain-containing protein [Rhizobium/Agrobacterium group]MBO9112631.1 helix-turn-helix domain-containing protein [Agrobacterium sp. S2/73]QXZ76130.1 helix-turn-helix domain-containing protein [Agrobacterium sp. S7/73]QYA17321.1 helix-turn-helix domain-containing protein [Rhizobium sp. AB2/73]UEQ85562.1 helix-turn-helix domain-containing protein [Rhizobium sp. AB2/73]